MTITRVSHSLNRESDTAAFGFYSSVAGLCKLVELGEVDKNELVVF